MLVLDDDASAVESAGGPRSLEASELDAMDALEVKMGIFLVLDDEVFDPGLLLLVVVSTAPSVRGLDTAVSDATDGLDAGEEVPWTLDVEVFAPALELEVVFADEASIAPSTGPSLAIVVSANEELDTDAEALAAADLEEVLALAGAFEADAAEVFPVEALLDPDIIVDAASGATFPAGAGGGVDVLAP